MDITQAILHLRANCPELGRRVAGAAEYQLLPEQAQLSLPAAYVVPLADDAEPNHDSGGLTQTVTESLGVVLVLDNTADRRGQASASSVESMKYAIHRAFLNWRGPADRADRTARGLQYDGASIVSIDGSRLIWQMTYSQEVTISDADGYQPDGDPLTHIDGHDERIYPGNRWTFDVAPPQ